MDYAESLERKKSNEGPRDLMSPVNGRLCSKGMTIVIPLLLSAFARRQILLILGVGSIANGNV